jgi:hypothetical protein
MAKSPEESVASMIENLEKKTGKGLDEWLKLAGGSKASKHGELVTFLKDKHGVTHGYANLIAHKYFKSSAVDAPSEAGLVDAQYAGPKSGLRPIYEAIIARVRQLGNDVEISPKKGYVSLRRNKQFALVQPSTATRLDVGINLKGEKPSTRLEASGSFNAMVSHRVRVASLGEIDDQLIGWLARAYEKA